MIAKEVKRKTAKIHADMDEVIVDNDGAVRAVATAVQELNQTTAIHAAWTEERFDNVDERFNSVDKRFDNIDRKFETVGKRFDEVHGRFRNADMRLAGLETGQIALRLSIAKMEAGIREDMQLQERGLRQGMVDMESRQQVDMGEVRAEARSNFAKVHGGFDEVHNEFARVHGTFAEANNSFGAVRGDIAALSARVEQVLAFAIRDQMKVGEISDKATE